MLIIVLWKKEAEKKQKRIFATRIFFPEAESCRRDISCIDFRLICVSISFLGADFLFFFLCFFSYMTMKKETVDDIPWNKIYCVNSKPQTTCVYSVFLRLQNHNCSLVTCPPHFQCVLFFVCLSTFFSISHEIFEIYVYPFRLISYVHKSFPYGR